MTNHATGSRRRLTLLGIALPVVLACAACALNLDSSERRNDDAVFTAYAAETDFGSYRSFAVDPVLHVAMLEASDRIEMAVADAGVSRELCAHVVSALDDRGYTEVPVGRDPDLGVKLTAIRGATAGAASKRQAWEDDGDYWGFPGWSYSYPYDVYYAYRAGSLIVDVTDLARGRAEVQVSAEAGTLSVVWMMVGYRAYVDDDIDTQVAGAKLAIDRAFDQSPYLAGN